MKTRTSIVSLLVATCTLSAAFTPVSQWRTPTRQSLVSLREGGKDGFSLGNLFGGSSESGGAAATKSNKKLEPHPSVRDHISPLNRLGPDVTSLESKGGEPLPVHPDVRSGTLPNGLPYIILPNKNPPDRFEAHLQVFSGSGKLFLL